MSQTEMSDFFLSRETQNIKALSPLQSCHDICSRRDIESLLKRGLSPSNLKCLVSFYIDRLQVFDMEKTHHLNVVCGKWIGESQYWTLEGGKHLKISNYISNSEWLITMDRLTPMWRYFLSITRPEKNNHEYTMPVDLTNKELNEKLQYAGTALFADCVSSPGKVKIVHRDAVRQEVPPYNLSFTSTVLVMDEKSGWFQINVPVELTSWCIGLQVSRLIFPQGEAVLLLDENRSEWRWTSAVAPSVLELFPYGTEMNKGPGEAIICYATPLERADHALVRALEPLPDRLRRAKFEYTDVRLPRDDSPIFLSKELRVYLQNFNITKIQFPCGLATRAITGDWEYKGMEMLDNEEIAEEYSEQQLILDSIHFCGKVPGGSFISTLHRILDMKEMLDTQGGRENSRSNGEYSTSFQSCVHTMGGVERYLKIRNLLAHAFQNQKDVHISCNSSINTISHFLKELGLLQFITGINGQNEDRTGWLRLHKKEGVFATAIKGFEHKDQYVKHVLGENTELCLFVDNCPVHNDAVFRIPRCCVVYGGRKESVDKEFIDVLSQTLEVFLSLPSQKTTLVCGFNYIFSRYPVNPE